MPSLSIVVTGWTLFDDSFLGFIFVSSNLTPDLILNDQTPFDSCFLKASDILYGVFLSSLPVFLGSSSKIRCRSVGEHKLKSKRRLSFICSGYVNGSTTKFSISYS